MPPKDTLYRKYRKYKKIYQMITGGAQRRRSNEITNQGIISRTLTDMLSSRRRGEFPGIQDYSNNTNLNNVRSRLLLIDNINTRQINFSGMKPLDKPFEHMTPLNIPGLDEPLRTSFLKPITVHGPFESYYPQGCDFYKICGQGSTGEQTVTLLGSGSYGDVFGVEFPSPEVSMRLTDQPLPYRFILKLVAYENMTINTENGLFEYWEYPITDPKRPENVEILTADLFRQLFISKDNCITPHIMLPIIAFRCPYQDISAPSELEGNSVLALIRMLSSIKRTTIKNKYRFQFSDKSLEKWGKTYRGPLGKIPNIDIQHSNNRRHQAKYLADQAKEYIRNLNPSRDMLVYVSEFSGYGTMVDWMWPPKPDSKWKILCFQLLYTMSVIQDRLPDWRHNDMSPRNILIQKLTVTEDNDGSGYLYQWGDHWFFIPVVDFSVRLWDFDFANCSELPNYKVYTQTTPDDPSTTKIHYEDYGILPTPCLQYDLHFLFNYMSTYYSEHYLRIPPETKQLIKEWLPELLQGNPDNNWVTSDGRLTKQAQTGRRNLSSIETRVIQSVDSSSSQTNIPYNQLTARRQIERHPLFSEFRVSDDKLAELQERARRGDRTVVINHFRYPTPTDD